MASRQAALPSHCIQWKRGFKIPAHQIAGTSQLPWRQPARLRRRAALAVLTDAQDPRRDREQDSRPQQAGTAVVFTHGPGHDSRQLQHNFVARDDSGVPSPPERIVGVQHRRCCIQLPHGFTEYFRLEAEEQRADGATARDEVSSGAVKYRELAGPGDPASWESSAGRQVAERFNVKINDQQQRLPRGAQHTRVDDCFGTIQDEHGRPASPRAIRNQGCSTGMTHYGPSSGTQGLLLVVRQARVRFAKHVYPRMRGGVSTPGGPAYIPNLRSY